MFVFTILCTTLSTEPSICHDSKTFTFIVYALKMIHLCTYSLTDECRMAPPQIKKKKKRSLTLHS